MNTLDELIIVASRVIMITITLFLILRILGKKQISQLTLFDYVIGITIGSIAADVIISLDKNLLYGYISLFIIGLLGILSSYLSIKSIKINELINGKSIPLIENGKLNYDNLSASKITILKLLEQARLKGYFDISLINYAILETTGEISFLPKEEYQYITPIDLKNSIKIKVNKQTLNIELIIDNIVIAENLNRIKKDINWLNKELAKLDVNENDYIYLAAYDENNILKVYIK